MYRDLRVREKKMRAVFGLKPSVENRGLFCPKIAGCPRSLEFARLRARCSPKALGRFLRPRAFFVACLIGVSRKY
jgi:hypothetical protein